MSGSSAMIRIGYPWNIRHGALSVGHLLGIPQLNPHRKAKGKAVPVLN